MELMLKAVCRDHGVVVSMFDFHRSDVVRIPVAAVKFHNVYETL